MSEITRYDTVLSSDSYESPNGRFVEFDDHDRELSALREELATANEKIDQAWNRSHALDHKGFIPGALDAWKRPVPQHLPYDFSGNPGASATQYCNGWNDSGGYWSGHASDLQQRLTAAEQRNAELQKDKDRLDALEANFWDVRHNSHPIADTGDSSSSLEIVGHWMDKPFERVIGENYNEDLRAAIDQAMTAPAYPPERPEYPEFDDLEQPTESGASE